MKQHFRGIKKREELAYLEAEQVYLKEMDICYILKRIHDIEKLKVLLLDKDQLNVFDNLSRSLIYINYYEQTKSEIYGQDMGDLKHLKLEKSLNNISKNKDNNEISKKLLFMMQSKFYDHLLNSSMKNIDETAN